MKAKEGLARRVLNVVKPLAPTEAYCLAILFVLRIYFIGQLEHEIEDGKFEFRDFL
ncbi:hypothetical protein DPMN_095692 [Dreissena polymorpha]|uniref:Uncharacterized protein n=1 Tax=Dreissena polymorpha TaxID=45954 RepID=A0A9D4R4R3_DREPO|nr:hypothetical protein DPMN_095692 [Dreissena polymorpha]